LGFFFFFFFDERAHIWCSGLYYSVSP
jgi:hypothetical protein